jgi:hypothetical protein
VKNDEKFSRLYAEINPDLFKKIKYLSIDKGKTLKEVIEEILYKYFKDIEQES